MLDSSRRFSTSLGSFSQRAYGALLLVLGLIAIVTPFSAGGWAISILGLIVLVAGVIGVIQGLRTQSPTSTTYLTGVLMILGWLLLFARPVMVIGGLLAFVAMWIGFIVVLWRLDPPFGTLAIAAIGSRIVQAQFAAVLFRLPMAGEMQPYVTERLIRHEQFRLAHPT